MRRSKGKRSFTAKRISAKESIERRNNLAELWMLSKKAVGEGCVSYLHTKKAKWILLARLVVSPQSTVSTTRKMPWTPLLKELLVHPHQLLQTTPRRSARESCLEIPQCACISDDLARRKATTVLEVVDHAADRVIKFIMRIM